MNIRISNKNTNLLLLGLVVFGISLTVFITHFYSRSATAANLSNFNPGHIIDDTIFTNSNSMTVNQIQAFMNGKVSSCDTNGTQPASDYGQPSMTHAQYAASQGWSSPPYTCLKDYTENGLSSAQIIYNTAQKYQINPEVLLVLLQKEEGLVTDTWPLATQYKTATGYGCPDTSGCDTKYYGFTNQVQWSAIMFHAIMTNSPTWYTPYILGNNFIYYNPSTSCGGSTVNIQNRATMALYNYTPYQPNSAALSVGYGLAPPCGSYGNRNFYLYFTDWFGSTLVTNTVYTTVYSSTMDSSGENAKVGFSLSSRPNAEVVLITALSDTTLGSFSTPYKITIEPSNWNRPDLNTITISGLSSATVTSPKNVYLSVQQIGSPDNNFSVIDPNSIGQPALLWQPPNAVVYRLFSSDLNKHVFASRQDDIAALENEGYALEEPAYTTCSAGDTAIDRYRNGNYTRLVSVDNSTEINQLSYAGYVDDGTISSTSNRSGYVPVYELYNQNSNDYVYTSSQSEASMIVSQFGYTNLGVAFNSCINSHNIPVFRLFNPSTKAHFYTTNVAERQTSEQNGYTDEGIAYYTTSTGTPVYRLNNPATNDHFFTTSASERDFALQHGYSDEGIGWNVDNTIATQPFYRLYNPSTKIHFYTSSSSERDTAVASGYTYEGLAW